MKVFHPSDCHLSTIDLPTHLHSAFHVDVVGTGNISLAFAYTSGITQTQQVFTIPYWLKSGKDCEDGVWFCVSELYNTIARWLAANDPIVARRWSFQQSYNWLTTNEARNVLIEAIRESPYSDKADQLKPTAIPTLSYSKLANVVPELVQVTGTYKSTRCFMSEWLVDDFFFAWLSAKSGYPLREWIKEELSTIDRSAIE